MENSVVVHLAGVTENDCRPPGSSRGVQMFFIGEIRDGVLELTVENGDKIEFSQGDIVTPEEVLAIAAAGWQIKWNGFPEQYIKARYLRENDAIAGEEYFGSVSVFCIIETRGEPRLKGRLIVPGDEICDDDLEHLKTQGYYVAKDIKNYWEK